MQIDYPATQSLPLNPHKIYNLQFLKSASQEFQIPNVDYLIFLDPDDYWALDCLQSCVDANNKMGGNCEIVWFRYKAFFDGVKQSDMPGILEQYGITEITTLTQEQWLDLHIQKGIRWFSWVVQGIVKFEFFKNGLRFLEGVFYEDTDFAIRLFFSIKNITILPKFNYFYRVHKNSATNHANKTNLHISAYALEICKKFEAPSLQKARKLYSEASYVLNLISIVKFLEQKIENGQMSREYTLKISEAAFDPLCPKIKYVVRSNDPFNLRSQVWMLKPYTQKQRFNVRFAVSFPRIYKFCNDLIKLNFLRKKKFEI